MLPVAPDTVLFKVTVATLLAPVKEMPVFAVAEREVPVKVPAPLIPASVAIEIFPPPDAVMEPARVKAELPVPTEEKISPLVPVTLTVPDMATLPGVELMAKVPASTEPVEAATLTPPPAWVIFTAARGVPVLPTAPFRATEPADPGAAVKVRVFTPAVELLTVPRLMEPPVETSVAVVAVAPGSVSVLLLKAMFPLVRMVTAPSISMPLDPAVTAARGAVPRPTSPLNTALPAPGVRVRVRAIEFEIVPLKLMFPPPAPVDTVSIPPRSVIFRLKVMAPPILVTATAAVVDRVPVLVPPKVMVPVPFVTVTPAAMIVPESESTAILPPPETLNAPPMVTRPLWFIVMPPAAVEAVMDPAVTLVKVVPVDENAGDVPDVTVTAPFIATGPLLVKRTLPARMIFDTVTPAFAELTVTEVSAVPLPTAPAKLTLPVPAAMPRLRAEVFDTVLLKETPPLADSMARSAPRLTGPLYVCKPMVLIVVVFIFIAMPVTCSEVSAVVPPMAPLNATVPAAFTAKT
jgi:hypothetical protein